MKWFLVAVTLFATTKTQGYRSVVLRHGGQLRASGGDFRTPQLEWDPSKGLVLGKDVISESIPGSHHNTRADVNQTAQQGTTAFLPCRVRHLADKKVGRKVTWIRRRDYHILTSGMHTQTMDERFSVVRGDEMEDWSLQIKFVQERDRGMYECQVPTKTGGYTYRVNLSVVVPEATIVGAKDRHIKSGSTISLLCIIKGTIGPSPYVFWFHDQKMINYDRTRGGINVVTEHSPQTTSQLTIADVTFDDTGTYTCSASNTNATVSVFVHEGDKMAAIQRRDSGGNRICDSWHLAAFIFTSSFLTVIHPLMFAPQSLIFPMKT